MKRFAVLILCQICQSCAADLGSPDASRVDIVTSDGSSAVDRVCVPRCENNACNGDGCGGICPCAAGMVCGIEGVCCTPENGAAACARVIQAWCQRIVMCCSAAGSNACMPWAYSLAQCTGNFVSRGFDCASPERTSMTICRESSIRCAGDIPLVACSDVLAGTANFPASCR